MKILIDIGHPAHVHYYRNLISLMKGEGNKFIIIARDRDVIFNLLDAYNIEYVSRGKGKDSIIGKVFYFFYAIFIIFKYSLINKVDVIISHGGIYTSIIGFLIRRHSITTEDTEHAKWSHRISKPFTTYYITPKSFYKNLGKKHLRIEALMEWFYLNPAYFVSDIGIKQKLGITNSEEYVIIRFVSWSAHHDVGQKGLSIDKKREIIDMLKDKYRIFISSESHLPQEFVQYKLPISPEEIHDVLSGATLFISESGTMASEASLLGTKTIYVNSLPLMCYLKLEQDYGLLKHFKNEEGLTNYLMNILDDKGLKDKAIRQRNIMVKPFIEPNRFFNWLLKDISRNGKILKENPIYQERFKL